MDGTLYYNASDMDRAIAEINKVTSTKSACLSNVSSIENVNVSSKLLAEIGISSLLTILSNIKLDLNKIDDWSIFLFKAKGELDKILEEKIFNDSLEELIIQGYNKSTVTIANGLSGTLLLPKGRESLDGLPLLVCLGGAGTKKETTAVRTFEKGYFLDAVIFIPHYPSTYDGKRYARNYLMNSINQIVAENNLDTNRISLYGFSKGAVAAYKIIAENPNYFSVLATCSPGTGDNSIALNNALPKQIAASNETVVIAFDNHNSQDTKKLIEGGVKNIITYNYSSPHDDFYIMSSPFFTDVVNIRRGEVSFEEPITKSVPFSDISALSLWNTDKNDNTWKGLENYTLPEEHYYEPISSVVTNSDTFGEKPVQFDTINELLGTDINNFEIAESDIKEQN